MARYFFDFVDGAYTTEDREGHDLPSIEAARREVLRALLEVCEHEPRDADHRRISCSVRDERGRVIYRARIALDGAMIPAF